MKITIIEHSRSDSIRGDFWSSTGGCLFHRACRTCLLYPYIAETRCSILRDRFIAAVTPTALPHTFDTDDYPEVLL